MAPSREVVAAIIVLDAQGQCVDLSAQASQWFGGRAGIEVLIHEAWFQSALRLVRGAGSSIELTQQRAETPWVFNFEVLASGTVVVTCRKPTPDVFERVLEVVCSGASFDETLAAVVTGVRAQLGVEAGISLLADGGRFQTVAGTKHETTGDDAGRKATWSCPLKDWGLLEIFAAAPWSPSPVQVQWLQRLARLVSLAVAQHQLRKEMRDAVERFELVLGTTQHVMYEWDLANHWLCWHARATDAFGHSAATRDVDWWREALHPEDRERVERSLQVALEGAQPAWLETYRFRRANGSWAWVQDVGRIQRDASGRAKRLVGVMQDVTEQRDLRSRLALSERLASVGTLAAGVAHEINNPLAWITSNVNFALEEFEHLKRAPRDPSEFIDDLVDALEDALAGAERVGVIVRDLKTFSHAQDERVGAIDVTQVLESAITMASNEIRHRGKLVRELHAIPPVEGNEGRLSQVFLNLLLNAAHALPENDHGRRPEIRVITGVDAQGRVSVAIQDTGLGIDPEVLPRIFDPFFTTKPVGQGTGLGLSICHSIITGMSGTIEVESRLGQGSTFRVLLPAKVVPQAKLPNMSKVAGSSNVHGEVMVIDDEPSIVSSVERLLSSAHHVTSFTSAIDALDALERIRPDVIFCDLMMPTLSGPEFFNRLKAKDASLAARVVFMTGGAFTNAAQEFLDSVQPPLLEKPFRPDDLRRAVTERLVRAA